MGGTWNRVSSKWRRKVLAQGCGERAGSGRVAEVGSGENGSGWWWWGSGYFGNKNCGGGE